MSVELGWHEQQLLDDLAQPIAEGDIAIIRDLEPLVAQLSHAFPLQMNRIDWDAIPGVELLPGPAERARGDYALVEPASELRGFWRDVLRAHHIADDTRVVVLGDSLTNFAMRMSIATLTRHLVAILSIPHHTYIFPDGVAWCFCYTAEDDALFAHRPA